MNEQQGGSSHDGDQEQPVDLLAPTEDQPRVKPRKRSGWLFVLPLVAWLACLGATAYAVFPLFPEPQTTEIPVTGEDPDRAPTSSPTQAPPQGDGSQGGGSQEGGSQKGEGSQPRGKDFIAQAKTQLEACTKSFRSYFLLEQLALDNPDIFQNGAWRGDATTAMQDFEDDCQTLDSLPAAPPAYQEVEHWLKLAAGEVKPATTSFSASLEKKQAGQFRESIQHMLQFVDYIHNAENAMNGMLDRKEI